MSGRNASTSEVTAAPTPGVLCAVSEKQQEERTRELQEKADADDAPPLEAIRYLPRGQHQDHERCKLREADQAEIEHVAGDRVHLPPDGDALHLHGQRRKYPRAQVEREMFVTEPGQAGG